MSVEAFLQELYGQALIILSNNGSSIDDVPFNWRVSKVKVTKDYSALLYFDYGAVILDEN